jgi:hypothetical protein
LQLNVFTKLEAATTLMTKISGGQTGYWPNDELPAPLAFFTIIKGIFHLFLDQESEYLTVHWSK